MTSLIRTRRHLPHWRLDGATYFVTWSLLPSVPTLSVQERDIVANALLHFQGSRYHLIAFAVMDDHIHALFSTLEDWQPNAIVSSWKTFCSNAFHKAGSREGKVWREEYFDRIIRNEVELLQKGEYILANPQRRWAGTREYKWVWHEGMDGYGAPSS